MSHLSFQIDPILDLHSLFRKTMVMSPIEWVQTSPKVAHQGNVSHTGGMKFTKHSPCILITVWIIAYTTTCCINLYLHTAKLCMVQKNTAAETEEIQNNPPTYPSFITAVYYCACQRCVYITTQ